MKAEDALELARSIRIERYEIDGLRVLLCPAQIPIVHTRVCINVGAVADPQGKAGLAHLTEHLLFQGTRTKGVKEISAQLAALGGHYDAQTSHYATLFSIDASAADRRCTLALLKEIIFEPSFGPKALSEMKGVIANEITEYANIPEHVIEEEGMRALFPTHPIRNPILGTRESLWGITREDLVGFHSDFYTRQNAVVAICGAVEGVLEEIKEEFEGIQKGKKVRKAQPAEAAQRAEKTIKKPGIEGAYLWLGFQAPSLVHSDRFSVSIANSILRRRLFTQVREMWGLVYDITSVYEPYADVGLVTIVTHTSNERAEEVRNRIFEQIEKLKEATAEDVELAKKRALIAFALDFESPANIADMAIEKELYAFDYVEILSRLISLTRDEVITAAEKYFNLDKCVSICLMGD